MMFLLMWLYVTAVTMLAVAVTVACVARRVVLMRDGCTRRLAGLWTLTGCDALAEPGVSLLVDYDGNEQTLEELLSLDYLRYEVVVVGNLAVDHSLARVVERYSMVEVGAPVVDERLSNSPRRLYRSRRRSYRRLVVVDSAAEHTAERLDCALAVRSYDRVLAVERGVRLSPEALRVMVWRACESPDTEVITAPVMTDDSVMGAVSEVWGFFGRCRTEVALMDGDTVVAVGGFSAPRGRGGATRRIVKRLRRAGCLRLRLGVAVGRNPKAVPRVGLVDFAVCHLLGYGAVLLWFGDHTMRRVAVLCLVILWLTGLMAAVGSRAFRRYSGSRRSWWQTIAVPLAVPFRIFLVRHRKNA